MPVTKPTKQFTARIGRLFGKSNFTTAFEIQLRGIKQSEFVNFIAYHKLSTQYSPVQGVLMILNENAEVLTGEQLTAL